MSEEDVGDGSTSMVISSAEEGASLPSSAIVFPLVADLATSAFPFVIIPSADRKSVSYTTSHKYNTIYNTTMAKFHGTQLKLPPEFELLLPTTPLLEFESSACMVSAGC